MGKIKTLEGVRKYFRETGRVFKESEKEEARKILNIVEKWMNENIEVIIGILKSEMKIQKLVKDLKNEEERMKVILGRFTAMLCTLYKNGVIKLL